MQRSLQLLAAVAIAVITTGCTITPSTSSSAAQRPQERCDTNAAQWAVGKINTEDNVSEARKRAGARMARVLRPNQPTTREFNAERLNLIVDTNGRFISANCS